MDCRVVVEAAVPVYDVSEPDEAVRIAISKTGEMLNPDLSYVEIAAAERHCGACGDAREPAFVVADEGLVALELELSVFNVEREEHAARIAQKEIGTEMVDIPLEVLRVEAEEGDDDSETPSQSEGENEATGGENGKAESEAEGEEENEPGEATEEENLVLEVDELLEDG